MQLALRSIVMEGQASQHFNYTDVNAIEFSDGMEDGCCSLYHATHNVCISLFTEAFCKRHTTGSNKGIDTIYLMYTGC